MTEFTVEDAARGERSVEERMTEKRERMSRSPNNTLESLGLDGNILENGLDFSDKMRTKNHKNDNREEKASQNESKKGSFG